MDFYRSFRWLLFSLIVLNLVDGVTTAIGVSVAGLEEGNVLVVSLFGDVVSFLVVKIIVLSGLLAGALVFLVHVHRPFPQLWENEAAFWTGAAVVLFYAVVVVNNLLLVTS
ncbi:MAG: DUF5658 family protein [Candidatus Woesearchaeota archaeon]